MGQAVRKLKPPSRPVAPSEPAIPKPKRQSVDIKSTPPVPREFPSRMTFYGQAYIIRHVLSIGTEDFFTDIRVLGFHFTSTARSHELCSRER